MTKKFKLALILFGLALLFFLIKRIGFFEIAEVISFIRLPFALAGVLVYVILMLLRSWKWFLLSKTMGVGVSYRTFLPFYLVNSLMGNLTPFKAGEAATPLLFKKYLKIELGKGFFVVIVDRFFELTAFAIALTIAIFYLLTKGVQGAFILPVFGTMTIVLFIVLTFLVIVLIAPKNIKKILNFVHLLRFIEKEVDIFYEALEFFKTKKVYKKMAFLTILCWICEISSYWLVLQSVFPILFMDAMTTQMISAMGTLLTFIPGGLGVGELGAVYILGLLKYSAVFAASGVLMTRFFLSGTLITGGVVGSIILGRSAAKEAENSENRF